MQNFARSLAGRLLNLLIIVSMNTFGCGNPYPKPVPGLADFQRSGLIEVPGGLFSAAGVGFLHERVDVDLDTALWPHHVGAVFSSASDAWQWSHALSYDGSNFKDPTGMAHAVGAVPNGSAIPGTVWVKVDPTAIKTKGGRVYHFDGQGRIDFLSWANTDYPQIKFVWGAGTLQTRLCTAAAVPLEFCTALFTITLGTFGPTEVVDERSAVAGVSRKALYAYDGIGRLTTALSAFEVEKGLPGTRYEYHGSARRLAAIVNSEGERIEYEWGNSGRLESITEVGAENPLHAFSYSIQDSNPAWYSVTYTNPLGGKTRVGFDALRRVIEVLRIDAGERRLITWVGAARRPDSIRDFDGSFYQFTWSDDDPATAVEPSGNVVTYTYEPNGIDFGRPRSRPVASIQDSIGLRTSVSYDALGRPNVYQNGELEPVTTTFSAAILDSVELPSGVTTTFTNYGLHGHWLDAVVSSQPGFPVRQKYDVVGNLMVAAAGSQRGGFIENDFDHGRQIESILVGASDEVGDVGTTGSIAMLRRSDGRLLQVSRPFGGEHVLEYDSLGRLERLRERVDGAWQDTTFEHDALRALTAIEKPNGMREEFDFDVYGRPLRHRALRNGTLEGEISFTWSGARIVQTDDSTRGQSETLSYDFAGRIASATYSALGETLSFGYDARSRLVSQTYAFGGQTREIRNEWDLADRRTRVYTFDDIGAEDDLLRFTHVDGQLTSVEYGNGLTRETLFDATTGDLSGYRTLDGTGAEVERTTVTRTAQASPTRLELTSETITPLATSKEVYRLGLGGSLQTLEGRIGRRIFGWQGWRDGVLEADDSYAWDELSNPANDTDGDVFSYNPERNRLLSAQVGGVTHGYAYDAAGFVTSRDGLSVGWSATGRLARVGPAGSPLVEIAWDMAGRPISVSALGQSRSFALFGGAVEYDAATQGVGELHLAHVSLPFAGSGRRYRHLDSLANVSFVSDESGTILSHKRYRPFGVDAVYGSDDFLAGEPRGFVGGVELRHQGITSGLVLLGARVLDSDVGRFLSPDPVLQLASQYTYAQGNPVQYVDADGRQAQVRAGDGGVAALEAEAANLDLQAGANTLVAATLGLAAIVANGIGVFAPPARVVAWGFGLLAAGYGTYAAHLSFQADGVRAVAAGVKVSQAASTPPPPPPEPPPRAGELSLGYEEDGLEIVPPNLNLPLSPAFVPGIAVCGPPASVPMPYWWVYAFGIVILGVLIFMRRNRVGDLDTPTPGLEPYLIWTRRGGIGLVFIAAFQWVLHLALFRDGGWARLWIFWLFVGMLGFDIWLSLSGRPHETRDDEPEG